MSEIKIVGPPLAPAKVVRAPRETRIFTTSAPSAGGGGGGGGPIAGAAALCNGRLTTVSGSPIVTSDQLARTIIYFTPFRGCEIGLYDPGGGVWEVARFSELSASLAGLPAGVNHDVFVARVDGVIGLELVAWTDNATRAVALALQDGIEVKSGAPDRRYVGTIRTAAAGQTEQSFGTIAAGGGLARQFVWNNYNRVEWAACVRESADTWSYGVEAWRAANNSPTYRVEFVVGLQQDLMRGAYCTGIAEYGAIGVGFDSTSAFAGISAVSANGAFAAAPARVVPAPGYHYLAALEYGRTNGAYLAAFWGDVGSPAKAQYGLYVEGRG